MVKKMGVIKLKKRIQAITLIVILLSLFVPITFAAKYPEPTNNFYVNDFAGILSAETEQAIMNVSVPLAEKTDAQIVIVTVDTIDGEALETYANTLFRDWGIGDAKKNNGVLLLIAYDDRLSRIEVGYGLEGALNDGKVGRILDDYLVGNFKAGDYDAGVLGTYYKLAEEVYKEYNLSADELESKNVYYAPSENAETDGTISIGEIFIGIIVVILIILDLIFNRGRMTRFIIYMAARGSKGGRGGGGGFGGGGGSSGGGGASRSW